MGENFHEADPRFKYYRYGISQNMYKANLDSPADVIAFFEPAHSFIDKAMDAGNNVMVHCLAGAHRAGTTGVSYMMKAGRLSYTEALRVAKKQRPVVDPMGHLEELLLKLEQAYKVLKFGAINTPEDLAKAEQTETTLMICVMP